MSGLPSFTFVIETACQFVSSEKYIHALYLEIAQLQLVAARALWRMNLLPAKQLFRFMSFWEGLPIGNRPSNPFPTLLRLLLYLIISTKCVSMYFIAAFKVGQYIYLP